ncbi:TPA: hypothetical protein VDW84_002090 [Pseudomonas aeruginosa]|uniref:hypothetical protein n=1 Tax=Pseudomonas aeruginosa TaxID=287 RepID=UPI00066CB2FF|nr:hypothetical protein [Pseudomonas aeruginosa]EKV5554022.1 hypothetical protein [Pseudomonas aeruginosa]KRV31926.1 hypothetical protein AN462_07840 [Pseudomonas aeruginosa]KSE30354.1 hypothetical protein AO916_20185 [Pseudomonas aeruginosa]MBH3630176.1 hypothetical protein [Pseudomonas aeruginosa]MBH4022138.1 hypothetical protein [Pseudomonas aeruginosa]
MRLISARQAWHDAFYESRSSVLAVAADKAALGKKGRVANETHPDRKDTNGRSAHMLAAGLVQAAIRSLPKPLQHFGHTLYSPIANGQDLNIAHSLVWFTAELPECSQRRQEIAYWMALAAIKSHKAAVNGRDAWAPGRVCEFVRDWYGTGPSAHNWARDWSGTWDRLAKAVDQLDAKALAPVARVVAKQSGLRRGPGWRWLQVDRNLVAEQRAATYAAQRDSACSRLHERLLRMTDAQLAAWFTRVKAYGVAYRAEWGDDVLEQPHVHARYHDRVAAYWEQLQRLGRVKKKVKKAAA